MRSRWQPFAAELRAVFAAAIFLIVTVVVVAAYSAGQQLPALWTLVDAGWAVCVDAAADFGR
ncbi:hypothetical protein [Nocardia altamirensis]|uniref:hypothetical protein n=1 Tax=Nocardia altamirensis TaxID=472158 RepID=UPI00084061A6|nr:hypothetical protein [Nocardia altamirensis]